MTYFISDTGQGVRVMGTGWEVEVGMVVRAVWGVCRHWSAGISDCGHLVQVIVSLFGGILTAHFCKTLI